jgi:O-antigen/teichoic acid export membrane protein
LRAAVATAGLSAIAADLLDLMVGDVYAPASRVIPWIALGVLLQGVYLLTSIGLNITRHTQYYPVATAAAAAASVLLNLLLIPRYGIVGAAWANTAAYAVQAGLAFQFSQRFYPVEYEWSRLARVLAAALLSYLVAGQLPAIPAWLGVLIRGTTVIVVMGAVLAVTGFFQQAEMEVLMRLRRAGRTAAATRPAETTEFAGEIIAADLPDDTERKEPR